MAQHEQPRRRTVPTGAVGVALVLALAGLIFATNARIAAATPEPAQDFPGLVQAEIERLVEYLQDLAMSRGMHADEIPAWGERRRATRDADVLDAIAYELETTT